MSHQNNKKSDSPPFISDNIKKVFAEEWKTFYEEHSILIWLLGLLFLVLVVLFNTGTGRQEKKEIKTLIAAVNPMRIEELKERYPKGFKILIIDDKTVIPALHDSLSSSFNINWTKTKILKNDGYEIRLELPKLSYRPNKLSLSDVQASIFYTSGTVFSLMNANGIELIAEVLETKNDKLICAVSFRNLAEDDGL